MLIAAILAPSAAIFISMDDNAQIVMDFSEEENKKENQEEKKEAKEKDFFLDHYLDYLASLQNEKVSISNLYIENDYNTSLAIFLPPPEYRL